MNMTQKSFGEATSRIFTGTEMVCELKTKMELGPDRISEFEQSMSALFAEPESEKDKEDPFVVPDGLKKLIEHLHMAVDYLYMRNHDFMDDFKCAIIKKKIEDLPVEVDEDGNTPIQSQWNKPKGDGFSYGNTQNVT